MDGHGYNPAEMPPHETAIGEALHAGAGTGTVGLVDLRPRRRRALPGDAVRVAVSVIRPDGRDAFARHVREVTAPAFQAVRPEVYATLRLLEPSEAEADGSWSFVWLMDPALPEADYEVAPVYEAYFGAERAAQRLAEWRDLHVGARRVLRTVQSEW